MIGKIISVIAGASITQQLIGAAVSLAVIGGAYLLWRSSIYNEGYQAAIEAIAREDKEAVDAANKARTRVRDCWDGGGVWRSGACQR